MKGGYFYLQPPWNMHTRGSFYGKSEKSKTDTSFQKVETQQTKEALGLNLFYPFLQKYSKELYIIELSTIAL